MAIGLTYYDNIVQEIHKNRTKSNDSIIVLYITT